MRLDPSWIAVAVSVVALLLIPALILMVRAAVRWSRAEGDIAEVKKSLHKMVDENEKAREEDKKRLDDILKDEKTVHNEILAQLRDDRAATDRRLRFIEEFWIKRGQGNVP